jgi:hypothetical protein
MPETKRDEGRDWMSDCAMKIYDEWVNNRAGDPDAIYAILRSFAPQPQDAQKLVETVRDRLIRIMDNGTSKTFAGDIYEDTDAVNAREANINLSKLESALGEKTVPMAMLRELFEYTADEPEHWDRIAQEVAIMIVQKHMPDYTVK